MRTITITALALALTTGLAAAQSQRSDRPGQATPDRVTLELTAALHTLEARQEDLRRQLAESPDNSTIRQQLAQLEVELHRIQAELHVHVQAAERARHEQQLTEAEALHAQAQLQHVTEQQQHELRAQAEALHAAEAELQRAEQLQRHEVEAHAEALHTARVRLQQAQELQRHALQAQLETRHTAEAQLHQAEQLQRHELEAHAQALHAAQAQLQQAEQRRRHELQAHTEALHVAEAQLQQAREQGQQELRARAEALRAAEEEVRSELSLDRSLDRLYGDGPRPSWAQQDPADSLWRAAREQMNMREYEAAARLYQRIHSESRYRQSTYRPDALYWHAFALNRTDSDDGARQALDLLTQLVREYQVEQRPADTNSLMTAVQARLARRGSREAVQQVRVTASSDEARVAYETAVALARVNEIEATRVRLDRERSALRATGVALETAVASEARAVDVRQALAAGVPLTYSRSLSAQCARDEAEIQLIALSSLVRMDTAAAIPVLQEVMARRDECAAPLRHSAMTIVARIQNQNAEELLVEAARNDPDNDVRRTALTYLASRDADQSVAIAEEKLHAAQDDDERRWALSVLGRMQNDRAWAVLRDYASQADASPQTRRAAVATLSQSNDDANTAFLRDLYGSVGDDRELKEAILMSSAFRRGGTDSAWLLGIAKSATEDAPLREFAVAALSRNDEVETAQFIALYDGAEEKRIKVTILRVLADRSAAEPIAADKLIAIARTETDIDLRRAAVLGLPRSDPRARELLLEILRSR